MRPTVRVPSSVTIVPSAAAGCVKSASAPLASGTTPPCQFAASPQAPPAGAVQTLAPVAAARTVTFSVVVPFAVSVVNS